jgi:glucose/arabinose dehydrogenase
MLLTYFLVIFKSFLSYILVYAIVQLFKKVRKLKKIIIVGTLLITIFLMTISSANLVNISTYKENDKNKEKSAMLNDILYVNFEIIADGLISPVTFANAGDGSNRLFIVDQTGVINIIKNGELLSEPFLDVSEKMVDLMEFFDERGLLGLAFHPDYKNNGRFFIYYSAPTMDENFNHTSIIAEYAVSLENEDIADPDSEQIILTIGQPDFNHDGGQLAFGLDGYLYIGLGDGGGAGDQHGEIGNGQDIETLLGSILRINIDGGGPYSIPPDNPFVGEEGLDEIYAYGLRNPWKFSFDRVTNELFVADVGQNEWEEIDIVVNGGNYGWRIMEGTHFYDEDLLDILGLTLDDLEMPIHEYSHSIGTSITGGYVYRGEEKSLLYGKYVFGDWSTSFLEPDGRIYYLSEDEPDSWNRYEFNLNEPFGRFVLGFGEDENGELYVLSKTTIGPTGTTGDVRKLIFNQPPSAPSITGQINGKINVEYDYIFSATDPEGEDVFFWILWGDGCPVIEWNGPYESGKEITFSHTFTNQGTFTISAKAKDINDLEGEWSELSVAMPRSKVVNHYSFLLRFLEQYMDIFPFLRYLIGSL